MSKENYAIAVDNVLKRYNRDRKWLSVLCNIQYGELERFLSSKKITYSGLKNLLMLGGVSMNIYIQGEEKPKDQTTRLAFLRQNLRSHRNGPDILKKITGNNNAPDTWWNNDDISMQDLLCLEKYFNFTLLYVFGGIGQTPDTVKTRTDKGVNWKMVSKETADRIRRNAPLRLKFLNDQEKKELLSPAVLMDYNPKTDFQASNLQPDEKNEEKNTKIGNLPDEAIAQLAKIKFSEEKNTSGQTVLQGTQHEVQSSPKTLDTQNITEPITKDEKIKNVTIRFKTADEITELAKIAERKGISRNALLYNMITEQLLHAADNGTPVQQAVTKPVQKEDAYKKWLSKQPKGLINTYAALLREYNSPWSVEDLPLGPDTPLAVKVLSATDNAEVFELTERLQEAVRKGEVPATAPRTPTLDETCNIELNRSTMLKIRMHNDTMYYLHSCPNHPYIECEISIPMLANSKTVITRIECVTEGERTYLVYTGHEKKLYTKKKISFSENDRPSYFELIDNWIQITRQARRNYEEYNIQRTRETVGKASDKMKESLEQVDAAITTFKQNFRVVIAELVASGKADEFIHENHGRLYSHPEVKEGKASILVTSDSGEMRLTEDQMPLQELIYLADQIKSFLH